MANQEDAPKPSRSPVAAASSAAVASWESTIDDQRARLMQVHGLMHCLHEVLLYADDEHSIIHADLAQLASELLNDCVAALDVVKLRRLLRQPGDSPAPGFPPGGLEVREAPPGEYLC